tara:strand:- start:142 stop:1275 length:1134 start_codon:yes stop_codon:yes gene_type:complete
MSKIKVNSLEGVGASTPAISIDNASGTCTANITNNLSNRNLIINGAMIISQRNGTSNTTIASGATYGVDRFSARSQTGSGHTMAQSTDTPVGFKNSVKITIGTGGTPSSGQKNYFYQTVEGNNIAHLEAGTANAKTVTFSFFVKSSLTGNFGAAITNGGADYSFTFPYTINSANTWEKKTKTVTLPSAGTWPTNTDGGLTVFFDLGSGSDYEGTPNQWNSAFDVRSSSDVKLVATSSATLFITGVQLEVGSVATDFEFLSHAVEKRLCMRYYQQYTNIVAVGYTGGSVSYHHGFTFPVEMRAAPTYSITNTGSSNGQYVTDSDNNGFIQSVAGSDLQAHNMAVHFNHSGSLTNYRAAILFGVDSTAYQTTHKLSAEL